MTAKKKSGMKTSFLVFSSFHLLDNLNIDINDSNDSGLAFLFVSTFKYEREIEWGIDEDDPKWMEIIALAILYASKNGEDLEIEWVCEKKKNRGRDWMWRASF